MEAYPLTFKLLFFSIILSMLIGAVVAIGSLSSKGWAKKISKTYISFIRGIPNLIILFLLYFGLPLVLGVFGVNMNKIDKSLYLIAGLSFGASANMSEMMRSAYLAVDKGQREAAYSVGMTPFQAFRRVIFPQAVGVAIPTFGNNVLNLFKETSLAFSVGVVDLLGKAKAINSANLGVYQLEVFIAAAVVFWISCFILENLFKLIENFYVRGRKKLTS